MSERYSDVSDVTERVRRVEYRVDRIERDVSEIKAEQAETRVYVKQIFERIDDLKTMIAANGKNNANWLNFAKWVIGGTIFIIVMYLFGDVQP